MTELMKKISMIPDSYDDFICGVVNYAKKNPRHIEILKNYLDSNENLTSSDVVEFIIRQPDFHEYSANATKVMVG
ncbi:MAG: hypothetical protein J6I66_06175 [Lachnospiraceae bacterium]|nr:hypothetical protein [Lachnospiraceae bacterium]